jgi:REP element-mobilizing transposase RayT
MGFHYRIIDEKPYFVTLTVIDWVDIFTRKNHKLAIVNSLKYCQQQKGLEIYAWCLMSNHLHMIISAKDGYKLSDILRDFKKYTSKEVVRLIEEEPESRRKWLLDRFEFAGRFNSKIKNYKFWQDGNHPVELYSPESTKQKLNYIHNNPVEEMIVSEAHEYLFSSARNYADLNGMLEVIII